MSNKSILLGPMSEKEQSRVLTTAAICSTAVFRPLDTWRDSLQQSRGSGLFLPSNLWKGMFRLASNKIIDDEIFNTSVNNLSKAYSITTGKDNALANPFRKAAIFCLARAGTLGIMHPLNGIEDFASRKRRRGEKPVLFKGYCRAVLRESSFISGNILFGEAFQSFLLRRRGVIHKALTDRFPFKDEKKADKATDILIACMKSGSAAACATCISTPIDLMGKPISGPKKGMMTARKAVRRGFYSAMTTGLFMVMLETKPHRRALQKLCSEKLDDNSE